MRSALKFLYNRTSITLSLLACTALLLPACVDDMGLINRTSPDKVDKRILEGVWMYGQTTVDVPYSSAVSFTGEQNFFASNFKMLFDIQEYQLIAYPVVERIDGSEKGFKSNKIRKYWDPDNRDEFVELYVGQPIAIWPITAHFDLNRAYNSYNGSQSNELVENMSDRPWYERDYIRVAWNQQVLTPFFYELLGGDGIFSYYAGQSHVGEPDEMTLDGETGYIDYVVRSIASSTGQDYCSKYQLSAYDCAPTEVKVRHSFRRLDHRRDYEPIRYHNMAEQDKFGFFATERSHYDEDWGPSYAGSIEFANRWNLWLNTYDFISPLDSDGVPLTIPCMADYDCDDDAGERCQKEVSWFEEGSCKIPVPKPYSDRGQRPIIYHLSADWHPDYIAEAYATAAGWNDVFKEAVSWLLFYEEIGQARVRGCESHEDCTSPADTPNLLVDVDIPVTFDGLPCHSDAQCGTAKCGQSGFCAVDRSCDTDSPCALGQTCENGVCISDGNTVEEIVETTGFRGSSLIYYGDGHVLTHDNFADSTLLELDSDKAFVRFINAAPDAGEVGLRIACESQCDGKSCGSDGCGGTCGLCGLDERCTTQGGCEATDTSKCVPNCAGKVCGDNGCGGSCGDCASGEECSLGICQADSGADDSAYDQVDILGGSFAADRDYDPQDPATEPFMAQASEVFGMTGIRFTAVSGGVNLASSPGDIVAGNSYTVLYNGEDVLVFGASFPDSQRGVRFIHASAGEGKLDFALAGVRQDKGVSYDTGSLYRNIAGDKQRATVSRAGTRGDFTCYTEDTVGRCVGWGVELDQEDFDRRETIKSEMPDQYLLCENQHDALAVLDQESIALALATKARILDDNYSMSADDHFSDAWYTYELEDGTQYNPCGDPNLVAYPEQLKKHGDLRYSYYYWINEMQRSGPLGYGPSIADPDTGQLISATANIYGGVIHYYSQYAADLLSLVNGDIDTEDVITGDWIRQALKKEDPTPKPDDVETFMGGLSSAFGLDAPHGDQSKQEMVPVDQEFSVRKDVFDSLAVPKPTFNEWEHPEILELMADPEVLRAAIEESMPQVDPKHFHDRLQKLKGSWIEDLMMNNEVMTAAQMMEPGEDMDYEQLKAMFSPVNWASKHAMKAEDERMKFFSRRNMYMGDFVDDSLWGLAKDLKEKGFTGEQLRLEVGRRVLRGVLEHEVGHTVGLRHNFSGSTDIFNFFDEYYDIREKDPVFCKSNDYCDELAGETCAIQECGTDDDCLVGTICYEGECSGPEAENSTTLTPTGACAFQDPDMTCNSVADCLNPDDDICDEGNCHVIARQYVPNSEISANERGKKRTEYQYSTVMDYGGRINSDIHGLGKYDYAAIQFGYTQLVDTYADTSQIYERIEQASELTGLPQEQFSYFLNTQWWPNRGLGFFHPFKYLTSYIGVDENLQRQPRPYEQVRYQHRMVSNDTREYLDFEYLEVPFAYCSDEYRGNMGCYLFDMGMDMGEMARHARDQLEEYYVFDAFKRERLFFGNYGNAMSYFSRIFSRYFSVLGDVGMYYAFYDTLLFRYSWYQSWKESPLDGATFERTAEKTFGYLQNVVSSPAPGSYKLVDAIDGTQAYENTSFETEEADSELNIPLGVGRFPYTQFGQSYGYHYQQHPLWFGSFWEKMGALLTLTDSTAYFVGQSVGEQLNIGVGTSLGYNTVFADKMNHFLGGVISGDMSHYAGRWDEVGQKYVPPSKALSNPAEGEIRTVTPGLNTLTLKLYSAVFGLAYLPAGFDPRFIDSTAVFLEGEATQYSHANEPGIEEHRFEDPIGGKVYVAYENNYDDQDDDVPAPGAQLVDSAQDLADLWADADTPGARAEIEQKLSDIREVLDILRELNHVYGASTLGF